MLRLLLVVLPLGRLRVQQFHSLAQRVRPHVAVPFRRAHGSGVAPPEDRAHLGQRHALLKQPRTEDVPEIVPAAMNLGLPLRPFPSFLERVDRRVYVGPGDAGDEGIASSPDTLGGEDGMRGRSGGAAGRGAVRKRRWCGGIAGVV